ncbi:FISUMP domain-containing protein [Dysgonomonas sp. 25]|uniref:FISUMP domain-containing protein n=1 Tax=Dysgonomonas sp. 25 TaxID=2302933 RepID=UPI0013D1DFCA|nr:FISUMP domain-containing protein [Dysgonomonas sp. 25]NDV68089.1 hypothetical protein [Dysgonomonas sp. 25]
MKRTLTWAILLIALTSTTVGLYAQVKIGDTTPPVAGAILELSQGATTSKGLGMPCVELTNLKPTTPTELSASIGGTGNWALNDHTALAVYNTKVDRCAQPEPIYEGLYVFDGAEWQFLGKKPEPSPDVYTFTDARDNEIYMARTFGAAGDWMLENLRYIPTAADYTHTTGYSGKCWCYPMSGGGLGGIIYNPTTAAAEWDTRAGILYNWMGATNGENTSTINQGQFSASPSAPGNDEVETKFETSPGAKDGKIQGICPAGWHLPSDRELNELEKEIYNNPTIYSQYTASDAILPVNWDKSWESGFSSSSPAYGYRGAGTANGHGLAMLSECKLLGSTDATGGKSLSALQGGFELYLSGYAFGRTYSYGTSSMLWSASSINNQDAWDRGFISSGAEVERYNPSRRSLFSVRCKKD